MLALQLTQPLRLKPTGPATTPVRQGNVGPTTGLTSAEPVSECDAGRAGQADTDPDQRERQAHRPERDVLLPQQQRGQQSEQAERERR